MIYFIKQANSNLVKVGYTANIKGIKSRLGVLQTGNPDILECIGSIGGGKDTEWLIHYLLKPYAIRGEWFDLPDNIVDALSHSNAKDEKVQVVDFTQDKRMVGVHEDLMDQNPWLWFSITASGPAR